MRIFSYLRHFPPLGEPLVGGTSIAVHGLSHGLASAGAEVTVLCEGDQSGHHTSPWGYGIRAFRSATSPSRFRIGAELAAFLRDEVSPGDLVLLNGQFSPGLHAISRSLLRRKVHYVAVPHSDYSVEQFQRNPQVKWPYWWLFESRFLAGAAAVQLLSHRFENRVRALGVRVPLLAIPNGCSPDMIPAPVVRPAAAPRFVFFGRLDLYNKGLDLLLDGFAHFRAHTESTLTLVGPDANGLASVLRERAERLGIAHSVFINGPDFITPKSILLAQYDVCCMPSRWEGFGLAALEAMVAGRVVLVSEAAGIASHVIGSGCGVAVAPTAEGVCQGLEILWTQRDAWPQMAEVGQRYALERLSWKTVGAEALELYKRLAARESVGAPAR